MKNKILFVIIFSFYSINILGQPANHNMMMVKEVSYIVKDSNIRGRDELFEKNPDYIETYNRKGGTIESIYYSKNGELLLKILNESNDENVHFKTTMYNSSNEITSYSIIEYKLDKTVKQILTYNKENQLIRTVSSTRDREKNLFETIIKDTKSAVGSRILYKYNDEDELLEELVYRLDGTLLEKKTYSYSGNISNMHKYNYKIDGSFTIIIFEYDEINNIKFQKWINEKGEVTHNSTYQYINDKNGNWITQKQYFEAKLFQITEREITYWE
jgi:hypothetical protein